MEGKKVTLALLEQKKKAHQPISMLTASDYPSALIMDQAGVDMILVGDSLGMVVLGYSSTIPVTMEVMLHHCRAVARGTQHALTVGDMPFGSFQVNKEEAVRNAIRFVQEGRMEAVKLEGGREVAGTIRAIVDAGIAVMGHIGLTPQSISKLGGYRVQGKSAAAAQKLLEDALSLQEAGCFSMVLEAMPAAVAAALSERLAIPTIGIGAGAGCDGQVLVLNDMLGLTQGHTPKFVRRYANMGEEIGRAVKGYIADVQARSFPGEEHTYPIDENELQEFLAGLK